MGLRRDERLVKTIIRIKRLGIMVKMIVKCINVEPKDRVLPFLHANFRVIHLSSFISVDGGI